MMMKTGMLHVGDVFEGFGSVEADWLEKEINLIEVLFEDEPCKDNYRLALKGDTKGEEEFEDAERSGCCGQVRHEIGPSPCGNTYLYGFNFGH
jgi:hypothetical protein